MKLQIITTQKTTQYDIKWAELNTPEGNIIIQDGHAPLIIELSAGYEFLYQLSNGNTESIMIVQGIAHVTRSDIKILLPMDL